MGLLLPCTVFIAEIYICSHNTLKKSATELTSEKVIPNPNYSKYILQKNGNSAAYKNPVDSDYSPFQQEG